MPASDWLSARSRVGCVAGSRVRARGASPPPRHPTRREMIASIATAPATAVVARGPPGPPASRAGPRSAPGARHSRRAIAGRSRLPRRDARCAGPPAAAPSARSPSPSPRPRPPSAPPRTRPPPATGSTGRERGTSMSPIDFLDETAPNPMKVLGKSIVAWKGEGARVGGRGGLVSASHGPAVPRVHLGG